MMTDTQEVKPLDDEDAFSKMTTEQIDEWKADALRRPSDFGYFGDNEEMFETWTLGPVIETRDSEIREKANAASIKKMLESDPSLEEDWEITGCKHWAVGWVDQVSFRVIDEKGELTRISRVIKGIFDSLEDGAILDEGLRSEMEYDDTLSNIRNHWNGSSSIKDDAPEDWPSQMYTWWSEADDYEAIDDPDGRAGGYPSKEQFEECARALGFWDEEEDEEE